MQAGERGLSPGLHGRQLHRAAPLVSAPTRTSGWRGGRLTAATGESVTVQVSDAYPPEQVSPQSWADFFAALPHGRELSSVVVQVAPAAEVAELCGADAQGCYGGGELVLLGEATPWSTPEEVARHEYGHHIAANRSNPPWTAAAWGPKRWATAARVCSRAAASTAYPGDEGEHYRLNPGEAFAESYRVLAEQKAGAPLATWGLVDGSFYPDAAALQAVEQDVATPWAAPTTTRVQSRFGAAGPRTRILAVPAPLDGQLTAELVLPSGRLDRFELLSGDGRVLARGLWAGPSTRRISFVVCGQRKLALRVTRVGAPGPFSVSVARP